MQPGTHTHPNGATLIIHDGGPACAPNGTLTGYPVHEHRERGVYITLTTSHICPYLGPRTCDERVHKKLINSLSKKDTKNFIPANLRIRTQETVLQKVPKTVPSVRHQSKVV